MTRLPTSCPKKKRPPKRQQKMLKRGIGITRKSRLKAKKRSVSETVRIYGSPERIAWMKSRGCVASKWSCAIWPREIVHVETGGMGRKADASETVTMCSVHHHQLHEIGIKTFEGIYGINLKDEAAKCDTAWQESQQRQSV